MRGMTMKQESMRQDEHDLEDGMGVKVKGLKF